MRGAGRAHQHGSAPKCRGGATAFRAKVPILGSAAALLNDSGGTTEIHEQHRDFVILRPERPSPVLPVNRRRAIDFTNRKPTPAGAISPSQVREISQT